MAEMLVALRDVMRVGYLVERLVDMMVEKLDFCLVEMLVDEKDKNSVVKKAVYLAECLVETLAC